MSAARERQASSLLARQLQRVLTPPGDSHETATYFHNATGARATASRCSGIGLCGQRPPAGAGGVARDAGEAEGFVEGGRGGVAHAEVQDAEVAAASGDD
jgi:hypothetical protein